MERLFHPLPQPNPLHLLLSSLTFCGPDSFLWAYFNEMYVGESLRHVARL